MINNMNIPDMDPAMMPSGFGQSNERGNLLSILIDIAFGFVLGLMIFVGPKEVIAYGSKLAGDLVKIANLEQQLGVSGFATGAAPYIVLAPILGKVLSQLASVRSLKSFMYFAAAVLVGCVVAYFTQGYFSALIA